MSKTLYRTENLELAALLRQLREDAGMVQTALADRMGRNQTFVSNVELGIRRLDLVELRDYCGSLDISLARLIERWEARLKPVGPRSGQKKRKS